MSATTSTAPLTASCVAARTWRAGLALGVAAAATVALVLVRLIERWRVAPAAIAHHITLLGLSLSYPAANAGAIVVLVLAGGGLLVLTVATAAAIRELSAARRVRRTLASRVSRTLPGGEFLIADDRPRAFCAGLWKPQVYVTTGTLEQLDRRALAVVLAHERHHARCRDPLRLAAARVLSQALFFVPGLEALLRRAGLLSELGADESAIAADPVGARPALARAILGFGGVESERVDRLLGVPATGVGFPVALSLVALATIGVFAALALFAGRVAAGSATLAPPLLSSQPCVLVLAGAPAFGALLALAWARGASDTYQ
jgi:Zn-dependent protease with chaperone function